MTGGPTDYWALAVILGVMTIVCFLLVTWLGL